MDPGSNNFIDGKYDVYAAATDQDGSKKKYCLTTHKFGVELPKTVEDNLEINCKIGTDFWEKASRKEINNLIITFEKLDGVMPQRMKTDNIKPGNNYCSTHMIFDLKWMESS